MNDDVIAILTALDLEYEAIRKRLTELQVHRHERGTRFEVGRLAGSGGRVALGLVGKGNHASAVLAERAIAEFSPITVLFVGVAGALHSHLALGDVVVATHIYAYHGGTSEDDGLKARPRAWEIPHALDQIARHVVRDDWAPPQPSGSPLPQVRFGPIAAGEVVQNSTISDQAKWLRQHYNDALAIEMEGAGVAQAAHLNESRAVVIRAVSDRADGTKTITDGANWQPKAVANAAAFATALAQALFLDGRHAPQPTSSTAKGEPMSYPIQNHNYATGNAHVGIQANQIHGGVWGTPTGSSTPPPNLAEQLAEFHNRLRQLRQAGEVNEVIYSAAESELEVVRTAMTRNTPQSNDTLKLALLKLSGLTSNIVDLGAKIAAIIATVGGMP